MESKLLKDLLSYYKYNPKGLCQKDGIKLCWNQPFITDHLVTHNSPDIVLIDGIKVAEIIDTTVPNDGNINSVCAVFRKYQGLAAGVKNFV